MAAPIGSDLVRLRDGSEWRGTIVERIAQSHVILVTYTGEAKRIEESELLYAGSASLAPQSLPPENIPRPPSASDRPAGTVRLTLRPARKLSIYLDDGHGLTRACEGDCIVDVPAGRYRTGLGRDGRSPVPAPGSIEIHEDDQLRGVYRSRRGYRIAGGVVLGLGTSAGLALIGTGIHQNNLPDVPGCEETRTCSLNDDSGTATIVTGAMIAVASVIAGSLLLSRKDRAFVQPHRSRVVLDGSDEIKTGQLEPAANLAQDREVLETERADVAACWQGQTKITDVHLQISSKGVPEHVSVQSEAFWTVRTCIENVLQRLDFAKGRARAVDYAF